VSSGHCVTVIIPGSLDFLRVVDRVSATVVEHMGFDENEQHAISISVIEACTNAIEHGCVCNDTKTVTVSFDMTGDSLKVTVVDPGSGFDPAGVKCDIGTSVEERGRGFAIIKALMDDVEFDFEKGTTITMTKRRSETREQTGT
jgi:serine/threonine-protein kinase RsbW